MATGCTGGDGILIEKVNWNSTFHERKIVFKVPVGDIPEEEIEEYVREIVKKFKKTENMENANYMHVEPNSHFWTDLNHLLNAIQINPEELTYDYLKIGLSNSKENGYELKQVKNIDVNIFGYTIFTSIEEMIKYVDFVHFNLFDLKTRIEDTLDFGFNLTNGIIMERTEIYKNIDGERDYQDANWGSRRQMDGTPDEEKPVAEWINYIEFHIGKAKEKVYHLDTEGATHELRKIAALAIRAMEIHGCPERIIKLDYNPNEGCNTCSCGNECEGKE